MMNSKNSVPLYNRDFIFLFAAHFTQGLGYASMILLQIYLVAIDANRTEIGLIMACSSFSGLLIRPVAGWALDTIGRKTTLIFGTMILSFSMAFFLLVSEINFLIFLIRLTMGVGLGILFTGYFTLASDVIPKKRRTEGLAIFGIAGLLPLLLNPMVGKFNLDPLSLKYFFPLVGGIIICSLFPLIKIKTPPNSNNSSKPLKFREVMHDLNTTALWPVWIASLFSSTAISICMSFSIVCAKKAGIPYPESFWFFYLIGAILIRILGGSISDRIGTSKLVIPSFILFVITAILQANLVNPYVFYIAGLLAGTAHGIIFPLLTSQLVTRSPFHLRGSAMAAFTGVWECTALIFTPLFGIIADYKGDNNMFITLSIMTFIGIFVWRHLENKWIAIKQKD